MLCVLCLIVFWGFSLVTSYSGVIKVTTATLLSKVFPAAGSTDSWPYTPPCFYVAGSLGTGLRPIAAVIEKSYQYQGGQIKNADYVYNLHIDLRKEVKGSLPGAQFVGYGMDSTATNRKAMQMLQDKFPASSLAHCMLESCD